MSAMLENDRGQDVVTFSGVVRHAHPATCSRSQHHCPAGMASDLSVASVAMTSRRSRGILATAFTRCRSHKVDGRGVSIECCIVLLMIDRVNIINSKCFFEAFLAGFLTIGDQSKSISHTTEKHRAVALHANKSETKYTVSSTGHANNRPDEALLRRHLFQRTPENGSIREKPD